MPSIVHIEGFDHQADLVRFDLGGAGAATQLLDRKGSDGINNDAVMTYDTSVVHHAHAGSASLHVLNPAAAANWTFNTTGTNPVAVSVFAFRFAQLPAAESRIYRVTDTNSDGHDLLINTTGGMRFQIAGGGGGVATGTVALNTWYILEVKTNVTTTTHSMTWKVYPAGLPGSPIIAERTDQRAGMVAGFTTTIVVGLGSATTAPCSYYLDDWVDSETSADYPLGEHYVRCFVPDGKGTHVPGTGAFQNFAGTTVTDVAPQNAHLDLDDRPGVSTTGVRQTAADPAGYLEFTMGTSAVVDQPDCVRIIGSYFPSGGLANSSDMRLIQAGNLSTASPFDASRVTATYEFHCHTLPRDPLGGVWSNAKLQTTNLRWGYSTAATNPPSLAEVFLEAAFPVVAGINVVGGAIPGSRIVVFGGTATGSSGTSVIGAAVDGGIQVFGGTAITGGGSAQVSAPSLDAVDGGTLEIFAGVSDGVNSYEPQDGFQEKADIVQNMSTTAEDQTLFVAFRVVDAGATGAALGTLGSTAAWATIHLLVTPNPVALTVFTPASDITIGARVGDVYAVAGQATVGSLLPTVTVNGTSVTLDSAGNFTYPLVLALGANPVLVVATEPGGALRSVSLLRTVTAVDPGGDSGSPGEPVDLSDDMLRIKRIIQESSLDPK